MKTTTPDVLEAAFVGAIEAIDPRYPGYQKVRWSHVEEGDVGGAMRRFRIDATPAVTDAPDGDVLHGIGEQYRFEMHVVTAYEGLRPEDKHIASQDGVDLRVALYKLVGVVPGLLNPHYDSPAAESFADDGRLTKCTYVFTVSYMQPTGLGN